MNRAGELLFVSCLFVIVFAVVQLCGCKPACTALDLAKEACVLIVTTDAQGQKVEVKVPGPVAMQYLETGRIGATRCK
jgi:hypothetical protein